jgi:serine O-acetyltransferase
VTGLGANVASNAGGVCRFAARGLVANAAHMYGRACEAGRELAGTMSEDMQAVRQRDPAARSDVEILTCYPGLHALWFHRAARALWKRQIPVAPRLVSQVGRLLTGIEIHPGAALGEGLFIDHGAGVVIGETAEVGRNVTIYQGVTLGGTGKETGKRHPTVGDNVIIGAGSLLLGSIKVGNNVRVGAGSVVVQDVPSNTTVVGNPGRPVIMDGAKVGIPDIDYTHLPDPVAEAMRCLVRRVVQLENELEELRGVTGVTTAVLGGASPEGIAPEGTAAEGTSPTSPEGRPQIPHPSRPLPAADDACDPARLDGVPDV